MHRKPRARFREAAQSRTGSCCKLSVSVSIASRCMQICNRKWLENTARARVLNNNSIIRVGGFPDQHSALSTSGTNLLPRPPRGCKERSLALFVSRGSADAKVLPRRADYPNRLSRVDRSLRPKGTKRPLPAWLRSSSSMDLCDNNSNNKGANGEEWVVVWILPIQVRSRGLDDISRWQSNRKLPPSLPLSLSLSLSLSLWSGRNLENWVKRVREEVEGAILFREGVIAKNRNASERDYILSRELNGDTMRITALPGWLLQIDVRLCSTTR